MCIQISDNKYFCFGSWKHKQSLFYILIFSVNEPFSQTYASIERDHKSAVSSFLWHFLSSGRMKGFKFIFRTG